MDDESAIPTAELCSNTGDLSIAMATPIRNRNVSDEIPSVTARPIPSVAAPSLPSANISVPPPTASISSQSLQGPSLSPAAQKGSEQSKEGEQGEQGEQGKQGKQGDEPTQLQDIVNQVANINIETREALQTLKSQNRPVFKVHTKDRPSVVSFSQDHAFDRMVENVDAYSIEQFLFSDLSENEQFNMCGGERQSELCNLLRAAETASGSVDVFSLNRCLFSSRRGAIEYMRRYNLFGQQLQKIVISQENCNTIRYLDTETPYPDLIFTKHRQELVVRQRRPDRLHRPELLVRQRRPEQCAEERPVDRPEQRSEYLTLNEIFKLNIF